MQRQVALKSEGCDERPRFKAFRGGYCYRQKKQTVKDDSLSGFAPLNSEMLNLWKGFVELVHYIDENKEWLDRELEVCKHLKY